MYMFLVCDIIIWFGLNYLPSFLQEAVTSIGFLHIESTDFGSLKIVYYK